MRSAVVLVALLGCSQKPSQHAAPPPVAADEDPTCPLLVPGTSIAAEDTDGGVALVFVTTGDAAAVRARAGKLAAAHNARPVEGDRLAETCHGCMADTVEIPAQAAVSDVPGGARVTFTAAKPDTAPALQEALRMHAGHLAHGGSCKMMM